MSKYFGILNLKIGQKNQLSRLRHDEDVSLSSMVIFSNGEYLFTLIIYIIVIYLVITAIKTSEAS